MTEDALNGKQTLKCLKLSRLHLLTSPEAQNIYINANQSTHTRIKKRIPVVKLNSPADSLPAYVPDQLEGKPRN